MPGKILKKNNTLVSDSKNTDGLFSSLFFSIASKFSTIIMSSKYETTNFTFKENKKGCCLSLMPWETRRSTVLTIFKNRIWTKQKKHCLSVSTQYSFCSFHKKATAAFQEWRPPGNTFQPHNGTFQNPPGILKNAAYHNSRSWSKISANLKSAIMTLSSVLPSKPLYSLLSKIPKQ